MNRLLAALPKEIQGDLERHSERVLLRRGDVLHNPGETIRHLYFPLTCLVSVTITTKEGWTAEAGAVGSHEMVGINAFMGGAETNQTTYTVQIPGDAIRIDSHPLLEAFDRNKAVRDVFLKYTQAYVAQLSQNAACNRLHNVDQRYARWLLCTRDRIESEELQLTQEFIAKMLGVRRPTVTDAAKRLAAQGFIIIKRGKTRIVNSDRLERLACECYAVLTSEYDRLLGKEPA